MNDIDVVHNIDEAIKHAEESYGLREMRQYARHLLMSDLGHVPPPTGEKSLEYALFASRARLKFQQLRNE